MSVGACPNLLCHKMQMLETDTLNLEELLEAEEVEVETSFVMLTHLFVT